MSVENLTIGGVSVPVVTVDEAIQPAPAVATEAPAAFDPKVGVVTPSGLRVFFDPSLPKNASRLAKAEDAYARRLSAKRPTVEAVAARVANEEPAVAPTAKATKKKAKAAKTVEPPAPAEVYNVASNLVDAVVGAITTPRTTWETSVNGVRVRVVVHAPDADTYSGRMTADNGSKAQLFDHRRPSMVNLKMARVWELAGAQGEPPTLPSDGK